MPTREIAAALLVAILATGCAWPGETIDTADAPNAATSDVALNQGLADKKVLITYQGMGTAVSLAVGVTFAAYESYEEVRQNKVVLSASSGGAVMAAWLSCHGLNKESIRKARQLILEFPAEFVNEKPKEKSFRIGAYQAARLPWLAPEADNDKIVEVVNNLFNCVPRLPLVIVASNVENVEMRDWRRYVRKPRKLNLEGLSQDEAFEKIYPPYPRVRRGEIMQPGQLKGQVLPRAGTRRVNHLTGTVFDAEGTIGKMCTYFATPALFDYLSALPAEERICDVRRIETSRELRHAVMASVSEPTYYHPWPEQFMDGPQGADIAAIDNANESLGATRALIQRGQLIRAWPTDRTGVPTGDADEVGRAYNGGVLISSVTRDILRGELRRLTSIGTGRAPYDTVRAFAMRTWFNVDINAINYLEQMNLDIQVPVPDKIANRTRSEEFAKQQLEYAEELASGYQEATKCFKAEDTEGAKPCLPPKPEEMPRSDPFGAQRVREGKQAMGEDTWNVVLPDRPVRRPFALKRQRLPEPFKP
jgi:hypothetical protein